MTEQDEDNNQRGGSRWKLVLLGFALVGAFFLLTEHRAHVFGYLPYLLLLACPLMHLFGHGGHGGHGRHRQQGRQEGDEGAQATVSTNDSAGPTQHRH